MQRSKIFTTGIVLALILTIFLPQSVSAQTNPQTISFQLMPRDNKEIPFQIRKGEEIRGTLSASTSATFDLTDKNNAFNICAFGRNIKSVSFYYVAEIDDTYLLVITDTTGNAPYVDLSYSITPSTLKPGQTSGETLSYWNGSAWQKGNAPTTQAPGTMQTTIVSASPITSNFQLMPWTNKTIPFQIHKGEEIRGTIKVSSAGMPSLPPTATFDLTDGNNTFNICTFGRNVQNNTFYYVAEIDGTYLLVITDTTGSAPLVDLSYSITASTLQPGKTSGETLSYWNGTAWQKTGAAAAPSPATSSSNWIWLIVVIVIVVVLIAIRSAVGRGSSDGTTTVIDKNGNVTVIK